MKILNDINEIDLKNIKLTNIVKKSIPSTSEYNKDTNTGFLVDEYYFYTLQSKVSNIASVFKRNLITFDFYTEESYGIATKNQKKLSIDCEVDHLYREEEEMLLIRVFGEIYKFKNLSSICDSDEVIVDIVTERMNDETFQVLSVNNFIALAINLEDTKIIYVIEYYKSKTNLVPRKTESIYVVSNDIKVKFDSHKAVENFKDLINDIRKKREGYEKFNNVADTLFGRNIFSFNFNIDNYYEIMNKFAEGVNNRFINQEIKVIIDNEYLFVPNNLLSNSVNALYYTKNKFYEEVDRDRKIKIRKVIRDSLERSYYCDVINPFTGIRLNENNEQQTINDMTVITTGRSYKNYFEKCYGVWILCEDEEKLNNFKASLEILDKLENAE